MPARRAAAAAPRATARRHAAARGARASATARSCRTSSFDLYPGEVLGVVALEGQGQDELFDILAGSDRPSGGELLVDGTAGLVPPSRGRDPGRPRLRRRRPRRGAADAALGAREHRAAVRARASARWGLINLGASERKRRRARSSTLQIDTRAGGEVRRLSGGNQQKVTIARWVAGGVQTMLCFDPTRGIDIRTKHQIYVLLRDLAEAGAADPALHVGAQGDPARLRPGDRHLRRPGGAEIDGRRRRRAGAAARRVQPASRTRRCPRRSPPRSSADRRRAADGGRRDRGGRRRRPDVSRRDATA